MVFSLRKIILSFLSPPVRMHGGLICITFCMSVTLPKPLEESHISGTVALRVTKFGQGTPPLHCRYPPVQAGPSQRQVGSLQRQVAFLLKITLKPQDSHFTEKLFPFAIIKISFFSLLPDCYGLIKMTGKCCRMKHEIEMGIIACHSMELLDPMKLGDFAWGHEQITWTN